MNLNPENLTRPESAAEQRLKKRYRAAIKKRGICAFCTCRQITFGIAHCRGQLDRQMGMCTTDRKLPAFRLDDTTIEEFRDAA
ncbi:hypothetical protein [Luteimonas fraxinea]|uniref:Uncharacterized protein n=1 Tax=Luteimonas fraxinea TaxID=2901869 RepID=A0ABS8UAF4_9GAMM|nr:hypothetical protein [Luteimonas fraxinea]MCD9096174.1 hypothetical protein [Luteimonas fraxinea]